MPVKPITLFLLFKIFASLVIILITTFTHSAATTSHDGVLRKNVDRELLRTKRYLGVRSASHPRSYRSDWETARQQRRYDVRNVNGLSPRSYVKEQVQDVQFQIHITKSWRGPMLRHNSPEYELLDGNLVDAITNEFSGDRHFIEARVLGFSKINSSTLANVGIKFYRTESDPVGHIQGMINTGWISSMMISKSHFKVLHVSIGNGKPTSWTPPNGLRLHLHPAVSNPNPTLPQQNDKKPAIPSHYTEVRVSVKLQQRWQPFLRDLKSPTSQLLTGNIDKAMDQAFIGSSTYLESKTLAFRESEENLVVADVAVRFTADESQAVNRLKHLVSTGHIGSMPVSSEFFETLAASKTVIKPENHEESNNTVIPSEAAPPVENKIAGNVMSPQLINTATTPINTVITNPKTEPFDSMLLEEAQGVKGTLVQSQNFEHNVTMPMTPSKPPLIVQENSTQPLTGAMTAQPNYYPQKQVASQPNPYKPTTVEHHSLQQLMEAITPGSQVSEPHDTAVGQEQLANTTSTSKLPSSVPTVTETQPPLDNRTQVIPTTLPAIEVTQATVPSEDAGPDLEAHLVLKQSWDSHLTDFNSLAYKILSSSIESAIVSIYEQAGTPSTVTVAKFSESFVIGNSVLSTSQEGTVAVDVFIHCVNNLKISAQPLKNMVISGDLSGVLVYPDSLTTEFSSSTNRGNNAASHAQVVSTADNQIRQRRYSMPSKRNDNGSNNGVVTIQHPDPKEVDKRSPGNEWGVLR